MTINLNESIIAELRATHWKDNDKRQALIGELVIHFNQSYDNYTDDEKTLIKTLKLLSLKEHYIPLPQEPLSLWLKYEIITHINHLDEDDYINRLFKMTDDYHTIAYELTQLLFESEILDGTYFYSRYEATTFVQRYLPELISLCDSLYTNNETTKPDLISYNIEREITSLVFDTTIKIFNEYINLYPSIESNTFLSNFVSWLDSKSEYELDQLMGI